MRRRTWRKRTADADLIVALIPGRFDAPLKAWQRRARQAHTDYGATILVTTETTGAAPPVKAIFAPLGLVPVRHDDEPGQNNCTVAYDPTRHALGLAYPALLSDLPSWRKGGARIPDNYGNVVALEDRGADAVDGIFAAHYPLENTPRRRQVKEDAIRNTHGVMSQARTAFPGCGRIFAADWNRNARRADVRAWFAREFPNLLPTWFGLRVIPPTHGGKRGSALDWVALSQHYEIVEAMVLPRRLGDPFDHRSQIVALNRRPANGRAGS